MKVATQFDGEQEFVEGDEVRVDIQDSDKYDHRLFQVSKVTADTIVVVSGNDLQLKLVLVQGELWDEDEDNVHFLRHAV